MDFFTLLGVRPGACEAEVNSAYRKKSLLYHPDRCPNDPLAAERFQQLTVARDFLRQLAGSGQASAAWTASPRRPQRPWASNARSPRSPASKASPRAAATSSQRKGGKSPVSKAQARSNGAAKKSSASQRAKAAERDREKQRKAKQARLEKERREKQKRRERALREREKERQQKQKVKLQQQLKREREREKARRGQPPHKRAKPEAQEEGVAGTGEGEEHGGDEEDAEEEEEEEEAPEAEEVRVEGSEAEEGEHAGGEGEEGEMEEEEEEEGEEGEEGEEEEEEEEVEADDAVMAAEGTADEDAEELTPRRAQAPAEDAGGAAVSSTASPRPKWRNLRVQPAEEQRRGSLSERLARALELEACEPVEVPIGARGMLASMVRSLGPRAFQAKSRAAFRWHAHEARVLAMVEQSLSAVRAAASRAAASAASEAEAVAADVATAQRHADAIAAAQREVAGQDKHVCRCREAVSRHEQSLSEAKAAEREATAEIRSVAQRESSSTQERRQATQALELFGKLEARGAPKKAMEANRMLKDVERGLQAAKLADTLTASHQRLVLPALRAEPERRSRDSEAALACAEGCLKEHLQELTDRLAEVSRDWGRAKEAERRARSAVATITDKKREASDALQAAKDELRVRNAALDAAKLARRLHEDKVKSLALAARERKAQLAEVDAVSSALEPIILCAAPGTC